MANTPDFFTSFVATSARLFNNLEHTFCLSSKRSAKALAMLLLVIARAAALVEAFIGLLVFGNMAKRRLQCDLSKGKSS